MFRFFGHNKIERLCDWKRRLFEKSALFHKSFSYLINFAGFKFESGKLLVVCFLWIKIIQIYICIFQSGWNVIKDFIK